MRDIHDFKRLKRRGAAMQAVHPPGAAVGARFELRELVVAMLHRAGHLIALGVVEMPQDAVVVKGVANEFHRGVRVVAAVLVVAADRVAAAVRVVAGSPLDA